MREANLYRKTNETEVSLSLNLDGTGTYQVDTGVGFLDHMLELFSKHSLIDLNVKAKGDLQVDNHHLVEDVGIVLGQALLQALGDCKGINRYGFFLLPMDESLSLVALDLSGRIYLAYDVAFNEGKIGQFETDLVEEFFRAVTANAKMTMHVKLLHGSNNHHIAESIFKGFARSLKEAVKIGNEAAGVPSTKGIL